MVRALDTMLWMDLWYYILCDRSLLVDEGQGVWYELWILYSGWTDGITVFLGDRSLLVDPRGYGKSSGYHTLDGPMVLRYYALGDRSLLVDPRGMVRALGQLRRR